MWRPEHSASGGIAALQSSHTKAAKAMQQRAAQQARRPGEQRRIVCNLTQKERAERLALREQQLQPS